MKNQVTVRNGKIRINRLFNAKTFEVFETVNSKNFLRKCVAYHGDSSPKYWKLSSYWDDIENWLK